MALGNEIDLGEGNQFKPEQRRVIPARPIFTKFDLRQPTQKLGVIEK